MKKTNITLLLAVLLSLGFAVSSFAAVVGSLHDMTRRGSLQQTVDAQVCVYCHSPHVDDIAVIADYNPLWNATVQTSTTFVPYGANNRSFTFDGVVSDPLVGPSRLCMSCHDGSIALDSALPGSSGITIGANFQVGNGSSLASDHPVGFDYIAVGGSGIGAGTGGTDLEINGAGSPYAGATIADFLFSSAAGEMMTCATCHDVHDNANGSFLLADNTGSALCLGCHVK